MREGPFHSIRKVVFVVYFLIPFDGFSIDLLATLRSRDAAFDNVALTYVKSGTFAIPWSPMLPDPARVKLPKDVQPVFPSVVSFRKMETLIRRGPEVTIAAQDMDQITEPTGTPPDITPGLPLLSKLSNRGGIRKVLYSTASIPTGYPGTNDYLDVWPIDTPMDMVQQQGMDIRLTCGLGLGEVLESVSRVEENGNGYLVCGEGSVLGMDKAEVCAHIDGDYIVRSATITTTNSGVYFRRYRIETSGTYDSSGFKIPRSGFLEITRLKKSAGDDGKDDLRFVGSVDSLRIDEVLGVKFNLSSDEYTKLVDMTPPRGTYVRDHVVNTNYVIGDRASSEDLTSLESEEVGGNHVEESRPLEGPSTAQVESSSAPTHDKAVTSENDGGRYLQIVLWLAAVVLVAFAVAGLMRHFFSKSGNTVSGGGFQ